MEEQGREVIEVVHPHLRLVTAGIDVELVQHILLREEGVRSLSGGMKRRLMIARALMHEPRLLILDEPTAGVDVEVRRSMREFLREINEMGVTIILTTHYIEEAEEMADRIGVIHRGELILVEEKSALMKKLGKKTLNLNLVEPLAALPADPSALLSPVQRRFETLPAPAAFLQGLRERSRIALLLEHVLPALDGIDTGLAPEVELHDAVEANVRWSMAQIRETPEGLSPVPE